MVMREVSESKELSGGSASSRLEVFTFGSKLLQVFPIPSIAIQSKEGIRPGGVASFSTCLCQSEVLSGWAGRVMVLKHGCFLAAGEFYPPQSLEVGEVDHEGMETTAG